jgi:hypothetical protein
VASGAKTDRAQLRKAFAALDAGDVLMVTRLDRLARSTRDLLNTLAAITDHRAGFRSLGDAWADITTAHGRLMLTVLGGLAEFERDLIHRLPTLAAATTSAAPRFHDSCLYAVDVGRWAAEVSPEKRSYQGQKTECAWCYHSRPDPLDTPRTGGRTGDCAAVGAARPFIAALSDGEAPRWRPGWERAAHACRASRYCYGKGFPYTISSIRGVPTSAAVMSILTYLPPTPNALNGERGGVVRDAEIDPSGVARDIVDAIGHRLAEFGDGDPVFCSRMVGIAKQFGQ